MVVSTVLAEIPSVGGERFENCLTNLPKWLNWEGIQKNSVKIKIIIS
jgi:hypothetical protein